MPIAPPPDDLGLWPKVRALSGWPEADEEALGALGDGWRDAGHAFAKAATFDYGPLGTAWPDIAGTAYRTRVRATLDGTAETADAMVQLAARADAYAAEVTKAKTDIRALIESNLPRYRELLAAQRRIADDILGPFVGQLAEMVNGILDTASVTLAPGAPAPAPLPVPPPDAGSGPHGSVTPGPADWAWRSILSGISLTAASAWPHAAEHLAHYLDNTGTDQIVDADEVVGEVPGLARSVDEQLASALRTAVTNAEANNMYGVPTSFATPWEEFNITPDENFDWHLAIGNVHHSMTGSVTVHPPDHPGGDPRVEVSYQVHLYDRYNWDNDPDKHALIGPIPAPDSMLSPLHRAGIAKEFDIRGVSDVVTTTREVPR